MKMMRLIGMLLCVLLLCPQTVAAAPAEDVSHAVGLIADFSYDNTDAVPEENIELKGYGDKDKGYNATQGDGDLYASVDGKEYRKLEWTKDGYSGVGIQPAMTGGARHPWGEGAFLEVRLSTVGWYDLTFSAQLGATNKGPRDYQLKYSLDGKSYTNLGEVYSLSDNKVMERAFQAVPLPKEAENVEMLYIRIAVVGDETVGGMQGFIGTTSGEVAVNEVEVSGSYHRELAQAAPTAEGEWSFTDLPWMLIVAFALTATIIFFILSWAIKQRKAEKEERDKNSEE